MFWLVVGCGGSWQVVVRGGGYILAGGGWWWVVVDIFWLVVDGGEWLWIYLAGLGWWWVVVDGGGWRHSLWDKKALFIIFQRLSVSKNCLRPKIAPLTILEDIKRGLSCKKWYSSIIVSNVFSLKLGWTKLKSELKGCQFLNGLQLKNDKKNNFRTSELNKDL